MLRRLLPRRLDLQVALVCVIAMVFTMPWFIVHEAGEELENFLSVVEQQTEVLASNIAVTSVEHIITNDFASLDKLLTRSALFPGIIDIQVANPQGRIISDVFINRAGVPETRFSSSPPLEVPEGNATLTVYKENRMEVWVPAESGKILGWVRMNYSLDHANEQKKERIRDYMLDAVVITAALIILLVLALRRPLKLISTAADFSSRLGEKSGEQIEIQPQSVELDKLYTALNQASSSLSEQDATIKKVVNDLESQKYALDEHSIVSIIDVQGNITYANDKLLGLTGYKTDELLGESCRIFGGDLHDDDFFNDIWDTIIGGNVWYGDIVNLDKQGHRIWLQTTIIPFLDSDGQPYEYIAIQTDISEQKKTEALLAEKNQTLKELAEQLDSKVKLRTAELQKANSELLHLNNVKSEFVSVVSHELRTPLTSIKSFAEILQDDFEDIDQDTRSHYLSIINEESVRLGKLINDVLDLQKIDAGKMTWNIEKTDLKKLASTTVELFSKSYEDKGVSLYLETSDDDLYANIDSDKIKQVLSNLLSNAYKFTEHGSVILELRKVTHDIDDEQVVDVSVTDTGAGIPEEEIDKIFGRFHQVDNSETREKGGSGLGLSICEEIIEHHDGELSVTSTLGKGSCFTFSLKLLDTSKKRIGDILVEAGVVTQEDIEFALAKQK